MDDDATTRLLVRQALEQDGWTVTEVEDGVDACDACDQVQPDIVLLDVAMPRLDGFETCARLRQRGRGRHVPIMMLTAVDDQASVAHAYEVGASDFLSKPINFIVLTQRLRQLHRAEQNARALRNEKDFVSAVVDSSAALVLVLDREGRVTRLNESCECSSGFSLAELQNQRVWDVLVSPDERERERAGFERLVAERGKAHYEGAWTAKDGSQREIVWSNSVLLDPEGDVEYVVCTGLDITERNRAEERVRFLALYDPLTGLPNRRLLKERVEQAIAVATNERVAVVVLNLDHFKDVNATWGHLAGDHVLTEVTKRLDRSLRLSDALAHHRQGPRAELGRQGGDEFTALITRVSDAREVATIVDRLQQALARPFRFGDHEFTITGSVGVALSPTDGTDSGTLLKNAESAMHAAREEMRGRYRFYSTSMHTHVSARLVLQSELRRAVSGGELRLHYQDKISTTSHCIVGAEALVRWQHPSRGLVSPAAFIDVAEDTGLIVPIGEWVMRQACDQVTNWLELGLQATPVAVNLSSAQFQVADLSASVAAVLNETALDPSYLEIEITESMIVRDLEQACTTLRRLKELGVKVAIDDFGTGHSTLSHLKDLPVDHLKIDRTFITQLATCEKSQAITRAIIALAHGLSLRVIAEGVETEEQLAFLRKEGCDEVQGFLVGRPLPADQFEGLLSRACAMQPALTTQVVRRGPSGSKPRRALRTRRV